MESVLCMLLMLGGQALPLLNYLSVIAMNR
jgi:hypothetical protein